MDLGKSSSSLWLVLHLHPKKRGSMEDQLVALAQRLHGVDLTCVFAAPPAPWLEDALEAAGVDVRTLDFARPLGAAAQLLAWWQKSRPQLVHFHFVRAYSPLVAAARLSGAAVVLNDHVTLMRGSESAAREAYKRLRASAWNALVDLRVAVSDVVRRSVIEIEHVDPRRVVVIENGIELGRFERADGRAFRRRLGGGPLVACVSRLSSEKGVESAIRMMPLVGRGARLIVVGDGPEHEDFSALAEELAPGAVQFLGVRDDVAEILAASDVVVVPSHWEEAFGLAAVEGMAAGKPVVVSRSGAMPSLIGDAGLVVPKKDPAALAGAVTRLLDDPLLGARLGKAARARARERFGMARYVDELCALYAGLCPSLAVERAA